MRISVLQEDLAKALTIVSRLVAPKATLPILANILIATDKGRLKLSATNLETGINLWLGGKIEKEGKLAIPARALTEFVSSLPAGKIDLETRQSTLQVSSNSFRASFMGMSADEFPKIQEFTGKEILVFEKDNLSSFLSQVVFAASSDEARPVLSGVLFKGEGKKISLIATDGYRLSVKTQTLPFLNLKKDLLLPAKTLLEVARLSHEVRGEENIKMGLIKENNQVVFILPEVELASRLVEGDFPDFTKILPKEASIRVLFDKEEFLRAVKIASIFAREQANIIKLKIEKDKLKVSSETPQLGANQSIIEAKVEGENLEVAFNYRFLLDFLTSVSDEEIVFETSGSLSPGVFRGGKDTSFTHIIMPVRIQD